MNPRGSRLACSLHSIDGCVGTYSAYPGDAPRTVKHVDPVQWDKPAGKDVLQASFSLIGDMGMTGTMLVLNRYQWLALVETRLDEPFYAAIVWGTNPLKVVEDAEMLLNRRRSA